jgi:arabinose-5-phosphate isomerase
MPSETAETVATARGIDPQRALALGRDVLATEAAAIHALEGRLGGAFLAAARVLFGCRGRVVVTGIGKSGHIARKLAATLASTGTPAFFVHAAEASHGDLGMITADDVVLLLSNSGETDELVSLMPHLKRQGAQLIALTGNEESRWRRRPMFTSMPASTSRPARWVSRRPRARPQRWRSAMRSR